jgi:5-methylthioadenosine/S-adenosylhomocysteine deaminase
MSLSLVRGRSVITHAIDRNNWNEIAGGAVLQENGIITAVGSFTDLSANILMCR